MDRTRPDLRARGHEQNSDERCGPMGAISALTSWHHRLMEAGGRAPYVQEMPMPRRPHPFEEITRPTYAEAHLAGLRIEGSRHEAVLSGVCPRCEHPFQYVHPLAGFRGLRRPRSRDTYSVQVACVCTEEHPGRPADDEGCGAYWILLLQRNGR
ncbi:hypothetical protein [Streptomyces sp. NPDC058656]|uniref:hypothetical protein n=1 Tax=unclassified Streptomyces TaxID=2593676 RepID=UPI00365CDF43